MAAACPRRTVQVRPRQRMSVRGKRIASRGSIGRDGNSNQNAGDRRDNASLRHTFELAALRRQERDEGPVRRHLGRARHLIPPLLARVRRRTRPARGHSPDPRRGRERARRMGDDEQPPRPRVQLLRRPGRRILDDLRRRGQHRRLRRRLFVHPNRPPSRQLHRRGLLRRRLRRRHPRLHLFRAAACRNYRALASLGDKQQGKSNS